MNRVKELLSYADVRNQSKENRQKLNLNLESGIKSKIEKVESFKREIEDRLELQKLARSVAADSQFNFRPAERKSKLTKSVS
jgi:predicted phage-related endonuclease